MREAGKPDAPVIGEWILKSARFELSDGAEGVDIYGPAPTGRMVITAAGRFTAILTAADRAAPTDGADMSALFKSMIAYSGDYVVDGDKLVIQVDLSQHPAWVGSEQVRFFQVEGDQFTLRSAEMAHPGFSNQLGRSTFRFSRAS